MKSKYKILLITLVLIFIFIFMFMFIYLNDYYKASDNINNYLKDSEEVKVIKNKNGYLFDGPGNENILVFYPGGKVEYTSYALLMNNLSKEGIDTFIVEMPFNLAFFKMIAIKEIKNEYDYESWYLGGHSLGGVVAASDTNNNDIKGLILLASYSTKKVECETLSIYGSNDKVLNLDKYQENKKNIINMKEVIIEGGNHANFANYGNQKHDKKATITRRKQQEKTIEEILMFIKKEN